MAELYVTNFSVAFYVPFLSPSQRVFFLHRNASYPIVAILNVS